MTAIRVYERAENDDNFGLSLVDDDARALGDGEVMIEVRSAGVNPSDVKAVLGNMPHAIWPRTPGRDFAGVVIAGPAAWIGEEVWGSGGELGIRRDGTHASRLVASVGTISLKPETLSMVEAGAVGVPFITAYEGLREAGGVKAGDNVLVFGANGKVGQAAIQLATRAGARVFGVERKEEGYQGHATSPVTMLGAEVQGVAADVRAATGGHGADIVYNTVGSPYFQSANEALAFGGRQILISTIERSVPFDIFSFYRGRHCFIGIDTLSLDSCAGAKILEELRPGFEDGSLKGFPIQDDSVFRLDQAGEAYRRVLRGSPHRVVLTP